jgi:LuxR family transcriptional regulator, maltose regulon positive regulatory protein
MGARKQIRRRLAKLSPPRLHNAVERERLFALLDAREQQPVVWIGGPAGSGKTTLVASYLQARKARTLWFQVDEGDKDPATFFHYLSEFAPRDGKRRSLPRLSAQDLEAFARHYFREFFSQCGSGTVLVLDNCQDAAGATFHLILRVACEELPRRTSIIALSRSLLPPELARLAAHGMVKQIEWSDLRLTAEEARALGEAKGGIDRARLESAYRLSDGWAVGLMLAIAYERTGASEAIARLRTREALFDYLLNEMLSRVSADARKVLTHAALFPQITVQHAERISGVESARQILEDLYRNQYLIDRKVDTELTFQFHDLFRDFLLEALARDLSGPELAELRKRAATMLESSGQINDAVQLFHQARDWEQVARAIKAHAYALLDQGRWQTLRDWYDGMPQATLDGDAWLINWLGRSLMIAEPNRAMTLLESAYQRFVAEGDDVGLFHVVRQMADITFLLGEPLTPFVHWSRALEGALIRTCRFSSVQLGIDAWGAYSDMTVFAADADGALMGEAQDYMLSALQAPEVTPLDRQKVAVGLFCQNLWGRADPDLMGAVLPILSAASNSNDIDPIVKHWYVFWSAIFEFMAVRHAQAILLFEKTIGIVTQFGLARAENTAHCFLSMSYLRCGMGEQADRALREAQRVCVPQRPIHWGTYNIALAHRHYHEGRLAQALETQHIATEAFISAHSSWLVISLAIEAAYSAQAVRLEDALALLNSASDRSTKRDYCLIDTLCSLVLAEVALRRADRPQALTHLRAGLQHARNPMKAGLLFCMTRCLPGLLTVAIDEGLEPEVVGVLIERWNLAPDATVQDRWPWPVKIYALGAFRVLVNGGPPPSKGKAHYKVLRLLKAIVAAGAREVAAQTLAEWVWPEADGDLAAASLRVTVHRLRKLLGHDDAVLYHDGKISLNDRLCWLDVWSFEAAADGGLALYKGHLLPQDDFPWMLGSRERLRAKFQRAAIAAGKRHETAGEYEAAAMLYESCLEADPSAEALYRQLMLCLKDAGRRTEALDAFQRCRRTLAATLSKETQQVYESLLRI